MSEAHRNRAGRRSGGNRPVPITPNLNTKVEYADCPNCGGPVAYRRDVPGLWPCPNCGAQLQLNPARK